MSAIGEVIHSSKKIVIKIGSNVLSDDQGHVNKETLHNIVEQVAELIGQGKHLIIVSSGAGICGVAAINKWSRRGDINYKQALCAIGQVELMNAYKEFFGDYDLHVGQMLLTRDDFGDHIRTLNIRNTLFTLVDEGVVPIINENDSVSVEEIKIGDNDTLGALTATLWNADLLIVLSDIDGVFDKNPKDHKDAELIDEVYDIDGLLDEIDSRGKSSFGTGGIVTKIQAARRVNEYGIPMVLVNGKKKDVIKNAMAGTGKGTVFFGKQGER
ncbi:glutamate 5-kinase [Sinanaerobacter chloroacetimidivorans]|jgi:glutamate 5-kinase|uniref:Glutamate 5-kinase n=1 Tax=Sinanaerobacter chloroacetimidivorans TaxID=2818044 RepID=A0A8J7W088_9FIRM|nr:glutamate 5-kinase [Sinanaerobacter chloroacetimidivorans]MBR0596865.1 glutamate 5-kinase [Sinanaerobacter chloroacetimidivorans]